MNRTNLLIESIDKKKDRSTKRKSARRDRFSRAIKLVYRGKLSPISARDPKSLRYEKLKATERRSGKLTALPDKLNPKYSRSGFRLRGHLAAVLRRSRGSFRRSNIEAPMTAFGSSRSLFI